MKTKINPIEDIDFEALGGMVPFQASDPAPQDPDPAEDPKEPAVDPMSPVDPPTEDPDPKDPDEDPVDPPTPDEPDEDDPADPEDPKDPQDPQDPEFATVPAELIETLGFEGLNPEDYTDDISGLRKLVEDGSHLLAEQNNKALFDQFPEVEQFYDYVSKGGDPGRFHEMTRQIVEYDQIQITDDNEHVQERVVKESLQYQGYEKEDIETMLERYKASGILKDQASLALKGLQKAVKAQKEYELEAATKAEEARKEEAKQYWTNVKETIKSSDSFKGISIPTKEKDAFFEYVSKPVKEGYTQRDLDALEMGLEEKIAVDWLLFKKFPLEELVEKKASTRSAASLRERIKSGRDPKGRKTAPPKPNAQKGDIHDLDLIN